MSGYFSQDNNHFKNYQFSGNTVYVYLPLKLFARIKSVTQRKKSPAHHDNQVNQQSYIQSKSKLCVF